MAEPKQNRGESKQDYGTPWALIRAVEKRWGPLTIDLAARPDNAKAPAFITPEEDSLKQDWVERIGSGRAWLNMEFADIEPWVRRCGLWLLRPKPSPKSDITTLTPASIGSEWFADHCEKRVKVVGLRPRIKYEGCHNLDKKTKQRTCAPGCVGCASYPKDCMLMLWGERFKDEPILQTWRWDIDEPGYYLVNSQQGLLK